MSNEPEAPERILGPQSPDEEAVYAYEGRIVDLENSVGKRDKRIAELEAKLATATAFIQSCVGGVCYSSVGFFSEQHETETSRVARTTIAELKEEPK